MGEPQRFLKNFATNQRSVWHQKEKKTNWAILDKQMNRAFSDHSYYIYYIYRWQEDRNVLIFMVTKTCVERNSTIRLKYVSYIGTLIVNRSNEVVLLMNKESSRIV